MNNLLGQFLIYLIPFLLIFTQCTSSKSTDTTPIIAALALASSTSTSTSTSTSLTVTSTAAANGGEMAAEYGCTLYGGSGSSPELSWTGAPTSTRSFAMLMSTVAPDTTKYNWVLYNIPSTTTTLPKNSTSIGTAGVGSDGPSAAYQPPCSSGLGTKSYTFTVYALSAAPTFTSTVTGSVLLSAISSTTVATGSMVLTLTR